MTTKSIMLIALVLIVALCAPVAAVWSNGKWIDSEHSDAYFGTATVVTDAQTGVTSKYQAVVSQPDIMTYTGHVYGNVKSGHVLDGGEIFVIHNDASPENVTTLGKFTPDGLFDDYWIPGNYTITLPQGTGSAAGAYTADSGWVGNLHPEYAHVTVNVGQVSRFTFIGNSVPTANSDVCVPKYTIISAFYGFNHQSCDPVTIHNGGYNKVHHDTVPGTPDTPAYYTVVPATYHAEVDSYAIVSGYPFDGYCKVVTGAASYDFMIGSTKYQIVGDNHALKYRKTVVTAAYYDGNCNKHTGWGSGDFYVGSQGYDFATHGQYTYTYHPMVTGTPGVAAYDEFVFVGNNNGDYQPNFVQVAPNHGTYNFHNGYFVYAGNNHGNYNVCGGDGYIAPTQSQQCTTDGNVVDVTSNVQSVVDSGVSQFKFLFDNAQNPGGIFDASGSILLSAITDPSPGYVKNVVIKYNNGCGITKTIETQEYKVIDLAAGTAE